MNKKQNFSITSENPQTREWFEFKYALLKKSLEKSGKLIKMKEGKK